MKTFGILSIISWINIYALVWTVMLYPPIREDMVAVIIAFILFFLVAATTLGKSSERKEDGRKDQPPTSL